MTIEAGTAPLRGDDTVLCSGGLDQISEGLKAQGKKPLPQVPSTPGMLGKSYLVPTAPGFKPRFESDEVWRPKANAARAAQPAALTQLLTGMDAAPVASGK